MGGKRTSICHPSLRHHIVNISHNKSRPKRGEGGEGGGGESEKGEKGKVGKEGEGKEGKGGEPLHDVLEINGELFFACVAEGVFSHLKER